MNVEKLSYLLLLSIITTILLFGTLISVIAIHEYGHLSMGRNAGIDVNEMNIGFKIPYLNKASVDITVGNVCIHINPILLGGYVKVPLEEVEKLKFYEKFIYYIAGCALNIITGILAVIALGIMNKTTLLRSIKQGLCFPISLITLEDIFEKAKSEHRKLFGENNQGIFRYLELFSMISFLLGIINLLPIFPLDGGKIFLIIAEELMTEGKAMELTMVASITNVIIISKRKKIANWLKEKVLTAL